MNGAPPTDRLRFRWRWRPYQARVLETVDRHLDDDRLHIVAAPGAGKTSLGLEVFRRLGRPALVLAPTLTIRRQWLLRLRDFLPPHERASSDALTSWTSTDLGEPAFFTVATYQSVLSRARRASDETPTTAEVATLVETLRRAAVGTLILDEAHHLRREWWRALQSVTESLSDVTLVSLTGTPPYDATGVEWRRYEELCGPIDDEISVPELVRAKTLCPHQDFVYAVAAREAEAREIRDHDEAVATTLTELLDGWFQDEVDAHPWVTEAAPDLDVLLGEPEVAVALLAYLRVTGAGLPPALLDALDLTPGQVPGLDRRRWQILIREYLYGGTFRADDDRRRALVVLLRERGLLWRRSLRIERSPAKERVLGLSGAKIDACVAINRAERVVRGEALRQVVLTDFIRDEVLEAPPGPMASDLGAVPVFDALVASAPAEAKTLALISGRVAIVHESRLDDVYRELGDAGDVRGVRIQHRPEWMRLEGVATGALVAAYTRLLGAGRLRTLVGTRSLLGEGWDAPVVNSLILVSFVGASVGTNQMRGRAIRSDSKALAKVASVWHVVSVSPGTPTGFLDVQALRERFRTFVGLSENGHTIESGLERLSLPPLVKPDDIRAFNAESLRRLERLDHVASGWERAIDASGPGRVVPTVSLRRPPTMRPLQLTRTLRYVLYEAGLAALFAAGEVVRRLAVDAGSGGGGGIALMVGCAVPMVAVAPKLLRAVKLAVLHAPIDGSVTQIGRALLETLETLELVTGDDLGVRTRRAPGGGVHVSLDGGTFYDRSLFADAMGELLGPVENPRYLITRPVSDLFGRRADYHAVPHVLGLKRERADVFHGAWIRHVGAGELVYTRREGGRARLLHARGRAFSNQFVDPTERLDRWQ